MQKLNLDSVQLKITKRIGDDIYSVNVNDIDNLKYRVIRAAHSIKDFKFKFQTYHWSDRKNPITVELVNFDPSILILITPEFPPCVRQSTIELAFDVLNAPHNYSNNAGCYSKSIELAENWMQQRIPDQIAAQDHLDDAKCFLEEAHIKVAAFDLFEATNKTNRNDYFTAHLYIRLFNSYLSKETRTKINGLRFDVEQKMTSLNRDEPVPRILTQVVTAISKELKPEHFEALKQKYTGHPVLLKAEKQDSLFDKMFDVLFQIDLETKNPKKALKATVKKKSVTFSAETLEEKFRHVKAIAAKALNDFGSPLLKEGYEIKKEDEAQLDLLITKIESDKEVSIFFDRMLKSLDAKRSNILLHQLKIKHINAAQKNGLIFRSFYLTLEFKKMLKEWNKKNASPACRPKV